MVRKHDRSRYVGSCTVVLCRAFHVRHLWVVVAPNCGAHRLLSTSSTSSKRLASNRCRSAVAVISLFSFFVHRYLGYHWYMVSFYQLHLLCASPVRQWLSQISKISQNRPGRHIFIRFPINMACLATHFLLQGSTVCH